MATKKQFDETRAFFERALTLALDQNQTNSDHHFYRQHTAQWAVILAELRAYMPSAVPTPSTKSKRALELDQ